MTLKIKKIKNKGNALQEYILLEATETINLAGYAVVDRTFNNEGEVSNIYRHIFPFPTQEVKKGELVSVWTKKGKYIYDKTEDGKPVHRFYWGSDAPIWNDKENEKAMVIKYSIVDQQSTSIPKSILRPPNLKYGGK